ncbi:hypothetical protein HYH02_010592 [Chlamydomonas schloesseri]|uniref:Protein kinase domain-containing protein n=1 Tax=Chlamydomonas schloesseri TaxID=2026947 RepID=A0A835TAU2_9CHLO|nr:hypothetical protein HYH02_010592 [Chlamydomonas schloesseri]|eukprot:KAG2439713.1 hypothetical protein HYH02_010592 [Chlamydomonas schloesseri]
MARSEASARLVTLYIGSDAACVDLLEALARMPDLELQGFWAVWEPLAARNAPEIEKAFVERMLQSATSTGIDIFNDTTATYLKDCLPAFDAQLLWGPPSDLRQVLAEPLRPGLPLPGTVATRLFLQHAELEGPLVSAAASKAAASADALSAHVRHVMDLEPFVGSEAYTARSTCIVVEDTLRLIVKHLPGQMRIHMDRNTADASGATIKSLRPDYLCWVNGALVLKGEEKARSAQLNAAIQELTTKMSTAWAAGLLPGKRPPCMLAYAAAGTMLQFFCIQPPESDGATHVQATPISDALDLNTALGRLGALTASCNIWRLLAGYASQAPTVPLEFGHISRSQDGLCTYCLLRGFVRKSIANFTTKHAPFTSFELLQEVYRKMSKEEHRRHIIQVYDVEGHAGLQLCDDVYIVHLAPVGVPCEGPPADLRTLARAVSGVLRGLAALHSEGFVHRDVRWPNVIFLPAERRWLLIDLEHAGREDCDCSGAQYPLQFWSTHTLDAGGKYTFRSDLRMVAEQLMCGGVELDAGGKDLLQQLLSGQLTAAAALEHKWLVGSARAAE